MYITAKENLALVKQNKSMVLESESFSVFQQDVLAIGFS